MRYVVAMGCAIVTTILAMKFLSGPVSNWLALQQHYESSDTAETINQIGFMATNLLGLIVGWTIGWALGAPLAKDDDDDDV